MSEASEADAGTALAGHLRDALAEDLAGNARLAGVLARTLCRAAPGRDACDWYHGFYPLLRCVGAAATPERHARFYAQTLATLARRGGFDRVLIPGAADSGMLRTVLSVYRAAGACAAIRVLDRCETPLVLCRRFAERCGTSIETQTCDLLESSFRADLHPAFDIACTHSLFALFPPAQRHAGIAACRALLRPGGKLVSTARIEANASEAGTRFTPSAARAFAARIRDAAAGYDFAPDRTAGDVFGLAMHYAERMVSWPFASAQRLVADLEANGFAVERLDVVEIPGRVKSSLAGAGTHQRATYAEFVVARV
jgi:hypothetical protein